jgi:poly(3-hydroxyalkanoate) synthetase
MSNIVINIQERPVFNDEYLEYLRYQILAELHSDAPILTREHWMKKRLIKIIKDHS